MNRWVSLLADEETVHGVDGEDESIAAARCSIGGHEVVVVASDFDVAAGTLSLAASRRFREGAAVARAEGRAMVCVATSGGARMEEGTAAFVQMVALAAEVRRVRDAGLAVIVHLAHPTTGGTLASWGSLGHVTLAQPEATVAFTGPRVGLALGEPFDEPAAHTAEGFLDAGLVDAVVEDAGLRPMVIDALDTIRGPVVGDGAPVVGASRGAAAVPECSDAGPEGWAAVRSSRRADRTDVLAALLSAASHTFRLRGDRVGGRDDATWAGLMRIAGRSVAVIGTVRDGDDAGRSSVHGLRTARRVLGVAEELGLAVVTVIDTSGAIIGSEAERGGIAGEIARSLDAWLTATVPTLSVIAGSGSGGGALAWVPADRVIAADDAWLAPIAPEAASLIVHRDTDHADVMADRHRLDASGLSAAGVIDQIHPVDQLVPAITAAVGSLVAAPGGRAARFARLADL